MWKNSWNHILVWSILFVNFIIIWRFQFLHLKVLNIQCCECAPFEYCSTAAVVGCKSAVHGAKRQLDPAPVVEGSDASPSALLFPQFCIIKWVKKCFSKKKISFSLKSTKKQKIIQLYTTKFQFKWKRGTKKKI